VQQPVILAMQIPGLLFKYHSGLKKEKKKGKNEYHKSYCFPPHLSALVSTHLFAQTPSQKDKNLINGASSTLFFHLLSA